MNRPLPLRLWLWRWREWMLERRIAEGERAMALVEQSHRQLRQARARIAELTPADRLLKDLAARRRRTVASR